MRQFELWKRDALEEDILKFFGVAPFEDSPNKHAQAALFSICRTYSAKHIAAACARLCAAQQRELAKERAREQG